MSLKRRTRIRKPAAPEFIGVGLIGAAALSAVFALAAFHRPNLPEPTDPIRTIETAPIDEEALRGILRDLEFDFRYEERDRPDADGRAVPVDTQNRPDTAVIARVSEGDGVLTVNIPQGDRDLAVHTAGLTPRFVPLPSLASVETWTAIGALTYALALYYFAAVYPAWRRRY